MTVRIRIKPGAAHARIGKIVESADGPALEVSVTSPPVDGKANAALLALLAKNWRLPKTALDIISGNKGRIKTILINGDPTELLRRLTASLDRPEPKEPTSKGKETHDG